MFVHVLGPVLITLAVCVPAGQASASAGCASLGGCRDGRVVWVMPQPSVEPGAQPQAEVTETVKPDKKPSFSAEPEPEGEVPWRSPVFGAIVVLMFVLLGAHRLVARSAPGLMGFAPLMPARVSGRSGQRSATSYLGGTVGVTGGGADGFLRAALVELVTRGGGRVVLGRAELRRLLGEPDPRILAALASRMHVCERLEDAVEYLELELLPDGAELHWFVIPGADAGVVEPLLDAPKLHGIVLGPWKRTRQVTAGGLLDGETVPTLTSAEAVERLHLYTLTL